MQRAGRGCFDVMRAGLRRTAVMWTAVLVATLWLSGSAVVAASVPRTFGPASMHAGFSAAPPPAGEAWQPVELPRSWSTSQLPEAATAVWIRIDFDDPRKPDESDVGTWAIYLPYLVAGGSVWLNGSLIEAVRTTTPERNVNWHRPFLISVPASMLRADGNQLLIRTPLEAGRTVLRFSNVVFGRQSDLLPAYERRIFWVQTMPRITIVVCLLVAVFALLIWWRRRSEVLYGLFGIAAAFWSLRTTTFVVEALPATQWYLWQMVVLAATGGFIVTLAIFTFRLAGFRLPRIERALFAYWLLGTVWFLAFGPERQNFVNKVWTGGLIPIGLSIFGMSAWIVWRDRNTASAVMPAALGLAVLAGWHDYAVEWYPQALNALLPGWPGQRMYLLHHAANLLLLAMAGLLTRRFIQAVGGLEALNVTLEARVADREHALAANYEQLAALQREKAAAEERQLIMRELHDGLGSQLFTSLSRLERGEMDEQQIASALRACIADMRLALDALASQSSDVGSALANFMFRWESQLRATSVQPHWDIDTGLDARGLTPHDALQLLRIAQEALTNVLKHARATQVHVRLARYGSELELAIEDNGRGLHSEPAQHSGRGLRNMQSRARLINGRLDLRSDSRGTCIVLKMPIAAPAVAALEGMARPSGGLHGIGST